jgi:hypothetical protein
MRPIPAGSGVVPKARGRRETRSEVPICVDEVGRLVNLACVKFQIQE